MPTPRLIRRLLSLVAAAALCLTCAAQPAELPPAAAAAVTAADLDLANCGAFRNGQPQSTDPACMLFSLGLADSPDKRLPYQLTWSAGKTWVERSDLEISAQLITFHYRVAFNAPATVGAVGFTTQQVAYLKAEAPYPGDPTKTDQWVWLETPPLQGHDHWVTLPQAVRTRALLFTDRLSTGASVLAPARILSHRLFSIAHEAGARASAEYTSSQIAGSRTAAAMDVALGRGPWQSNGKNDSGTINGPFISDVEPVWFMLTWDSARPLAGLFLRDNFRQFRLQTFTGAATADPLAASDDDWETIKAERFAMTEVRNFNSTLYLRWLWFNESLRTRALRFRITGADGGPNAKSTQIAYIDSLLAFTDLGTAPVPAVRTAGTEQPPFAIPYELAHDGLFTLAVNDAQGQRVRNLVARVERRAGAGAEPWDLRDEAGKYVPPGSYEWRAITHPGLTLRYEMTPYPNVAESHSDRTPWLNERAGAGGWMMDHSAPYGACTVGDTVFLNGPTCESGVGFIACDLTGRKLWAISAFDNFTSGMNTATDGVNVFVEQAGWGAYGSADEGADRIWSVDPTTQAYRKIFSQREDARRKRGIRGLAARAGKLYTAVNATPDWLAGPVGMDGVDLARCLPAYKEPRKPKMAYEVVPDPGNDFFRLWRLKSTPPGNGGNSVGLLELESTRGPERRQFAVLAFREPVALGGAVLPVPRDVPYTLTLSVLKPDAPAKFNPEDDTQWQPFEQQAKLPWDVAVAPPDTRTRAIRLTFKRTTGGGGDTEEVMEELGAAAPEGDGTAATGKAWCGQLEGIKLLRWRFQNLAATAKVTVNSGSLNPATGEWDAQRQAAVTPDAPGIYMLAWDTPQSLRGLAIKEIDGRFTEIEAWTGTGAPDLVATAGWQKLARYEQKLRYYYVPDIQHNSQARYLDGYVDFGRDVSTRALRLRVVEQWLWKEEGRPGCAGVRKDRGGQELDAARCRIYGVAPLHYLGGETPVDPLMFARLECLDGMTGRVEAEYPLAKPGKLAFAPDGTLYAVSGDTDIVRVDLAGGAPRPVVTDLIKAQAFTVAADGHFYVFDAAPARQVIRVYSPEGKYLRDIGEPGGYQAGPWNPHRLSNITGLAADKLGQLWAVSNDYWPKRVALLKTDGTWVRDYLGPTAYGGGGVLDPGDQRRLFYGPLEFELDWATGATHLKNLTRLDTNPSDCTAGTAMGEVPIRRDGRTYLVSRPQFASQPCGVVYLYENNRAKLVAAVGVAQYFPPLKNMAIITRVFPKTLNTLQFTWSDRNGDGQVQFEECRFADLRIRDLTSFDRQLNIQAGATAFEVSEILPNGAPVYEEKSYPLPVTARYGDSVVYRLDNGTFYRFGGGKDVPEAGFAADGHPLWSWKNEGHGVGPQNSCAPFSSDQVVCQFGIIGHETAAAGDLGEFFVIHGNLGGWNLWTADGLLAGRIFRDMRDPKRVSWTMKDHARGMPLDDVTLGGEHFAGWFCRSTADGKYYAVAGHHQTNVLEVQGLDQFKRLSGRLTVSPADIAKAQEWDRATARARARGTVRLLEATPVAGIVLDGALDDWGTAATASLAGPGGRVTFRVTCDARNLYAAWEVCDRGPFRNTGRQWDLMFKTGACVDLMIGADSAANPARQAPVGGDKRLLFAPTADGKVTAVLYDAVVPGAPAENRWQVNTPGGGITTFDVVRRLDTVRAVAKPRLAPGSTTPSGYIVEAAIPLQELGLKPTDGTCIKFDWGILESDQEGSVVLARSYWSNQATFHLADVPSEARIQPDLWGYLKFRARAQGKAGLGDDLERGTVPGKGDGLELDAE